MSVARTVDCNEVLKRLQADLHIKTKILEYYLALAGIVYKNLYELMKKSKLEEPFISELLYQAWKKPIDALLDEIFDNAETIARVLAYRLYNADVCYVTQDGVYVSYRLDSVLQKLQKAGLLTYTQRSHHSQNNEQSRGQE